MRWISSKWALHAVIACLLVLQTASGELSSFKGLFKDPSDNNVGKDAKQGLGGLFSAPKDGDGKISGSIFDKPSSTFDPFSKIQKGVTEMQVDTVINTAQDQVITETSAPSLGAKRLKDFSADRQPADSKFGKTTRGFPLFENIPDIKNGNSLFATTTSKPPPPLNPIQRIQKGIADFTINMVLDNVKAMIENISRATIEYLDKLKEAGRI